MRKPLELRVYDRNEDGDYLEAPASDGKRYVISQEDVEVYCMDKAFTDAELAAEYQNSRLVSYVRHRRVENYPGDKVLFDHYERGLEQEWNLERFATLPHYDEVA